MTDYNVGASVSMSGDASGRKPSWLEWTDASTLAGTAKLPSGYRRVKTISGTAVTTHDINVLPVSLPSTDAPWRCVVYAKGGGYIVMDGLTGVPTVGTPTVRLTADGPSKAVVQVPIMPGAQSILSSSFAGWSNGGTDAVARGMEMTVEYRDADTGQMVLVFRGIIYQVDRGDTVTLTAYDRLMDLATYSEQYQSVQGHVTDRVSTARTISGTTYTYDMGTDISSVTGCNFRNLLEINALAQMSLEGGAILPAVAHAMPVAGGVQAGQTIKHLAVRVYAAFSNASAGNVVHAQFYRFVKVTGGVAPMGRSAEVTASVGYTEQTLTMEADVNWSASSTYYIGVRTWATTDVEGADAFTTLLKSGTRYTTDAGKYWIPSSDNVWSAWRTQFTEANKPEIAVRFLKDGDAVADTSVLTVSGSTVSIDKSNIPVPSGDYITVQDRGVAIILDFYPDTAVALSTLVSDMITSAGLSPDVFGQVDGYTSYYTTSTYDYLTCVNELIKASHCMAWADINSAGIVRILPRHTIDETAQYTYTTDPSSAGTQAIVSHNLTAHWMAEKATVAYLAEDTTSSGLPVALETDDALMTDSLVEALGTPLRQVIADRSQGTHALQANTAGGRIVQLHTNVFEGSVVLAGYRTALWDLTGSAAGGVPVALDVPEAAVNGTALPTQVILHDGVTEVALDNVRTADRSEVAVSMGLTADAISNGEGQLPKTVYLFARTVNYAERTGYTQGTLTSVGLVRSGAGTVTQTTAAYLKTATDAAGYIHYCAIFRAADAPDSGYSPSNDIVAVTVTAGGTTWTSVLDNPRRALSNQAVHVDVRVRKA